MDASDAACLPPIERGNDGDAQAKGGERYGKSSKYHGASSGFGWSGWKEIEIVRIAKGGEVIDCLCDPRSRVGRPSRKSILHDRSQCGFLGQIAPAIEMQVFDQD